MGRNFCDLSGDKYYTGAELGRRLEVRLEKDGLKHPQYYKGAMVRLLKEAGVKNVDGKWLGKFAIPVMKAEFERVKNNPKNKKAKSVGKQTSQNKSQNIKNNVKSTSSIPYHMTIGDLHPIRIESVAGESFLIVFTGFETLRIRRKDIQSLSPYMPDIFTNDGFHDGTIIELPFEKYIRVIHSRHKLVDAINKACDEEELKEQIRELQEELAKYQNKERGNDNG